MKDTKEHVAVGFINFGHARDVIEDAAAVPPGYGPLVYLTTMVDEADKRMIASLADRYRISRGVVLREILSQWREAQLARE